MKREIYAPNLWNLLAAHQGQTMNVASQEITPKQIRGLYVMKKGKRLLVILVQRWRKREHLAATRHWLSLKRVTSYFFNQAAPLRLPHLKCLLVLCLQCHKRVPNKLQSIPSNKHVVLRAPFKLYGSLTQHSGAGQAKRERKSYAEKGGKPLSNTLRKYR